MHAKLIISKNKKDSDIYISALAKKQSALVVDTQVQKISDVRDLKADIKLSKSNPEIYKIDNLDNASIEAQNALLKTLEEPSRNSFFALTARKEKSLLPTIVSRCEVVRLKEKRTTSAKSKSFINADATIKLQKIDKLRNREDALKFIENLLDDLSLDPAKTTKTIEKIDVISKTLDQLNKNANIQLALTNMVINLE